MKKKIILGICILLAIILLVPFPLHYKDGGTIEYKAILYSVYDVHAINPDPKSNQDYLDGIRIEIFGIEVFDNVPWTRKR